MYDSGAPALSVVKLVVMATVAVHLSCPGLFLICFIIIFAIEALLYLICLVNLWFTAGSPECLALIEVLQTINLKQLTADYQSVYRITTNQWEKEEVETF